MVNPQTFAERGGIVELSKQKILTPQEKQCPYCGQIIQYSKNPFRLIRTGNCVHYYYDPFGGDIVFKEG